MAYPPPDEPRQPYGETGQPGEPGQPGQYGQPAQPGQPGQYRQYPRPGYGGPAGTNVMAILALVFAFVFAPAGIVLGHIARRQIRRTGEQGAQLATWGLVLSYIFTALYVVGCCAWIGLLIWAGSDDNVGSY
jgi:hypothetical protein